MAALCKGRSLQESTGYGGPLRHLPWGKSCSRGFKGLKTSGPTGIFSPSVLRRAQRRTVLLLRFLTSTPAVLASGCALHQAASTFPAASAAVVFLGVTCQHRTLHKTELGAQPAPTPLVSESRRAVASTKHQDADPPPTTRASSSAPVVSPLHVFPLLFTNAHRAFSPLRATNPALRLGDTEGLLISTLLRLRAAHRERGSFGLRPSSHTEDLPTGSHGTRALLPPYADRASAHF